MGVRYRFSLWIQRWRNSPISGCTLSSKTSPENLDKHFQTKKLWLVFWNCKGILLTEFIQPGSMEMDYIVKLWISFRGQSKTEGTSISLRGNAQPDAVAHTKTLLQQFSWEIFDHSSYNMDLVLTSYYLFSKMKVWLTTWCFKTGEDLIDGVNIKLDAVACCSLMRDCKS